MKPGEADLRFRVAALVRRRAMELPAPSDVARKSSSVGTSDHQPCTKKQQRWCLTPPTMLKKAAPLVPHTTTVAQKSSDVATSHHQQCSKKQLRWCFIPPPLHKKAATVVPGGSNVGGEGISRFLVADGDQPPVSHLALDWPGRDPRPGLHTRPAAAARSGASRNPAYAPAGALLLCVAKEVGKKGDPAEPVVGFADDCLALLTTGGRRRTRGLRPLRQLRRTSPPVAPLLGGSEGAFSRYRAFTEAAGGVDEFVRVREKWVRLVSCATLGCRVTPCGLTRPTLLFTAFRFSLFSSITHARAETRGDSEKPLLSRRAAEHWAGPSGAAV